MVEYHNRLKYSGHCIALPFGDCQSPNQSRPRPEIQFDSNEKDIDSEISHLLKLGAIEPAVHSPDEYISTTFVRKKKSGKYRMILNLKGLNKHIEKHHFKMDTV